MSWPPPRPRSNSEQLGATRSNSEQLGAARNKFMTGASTGSTSGLSRSESLRVAPSRSESLRDALSRSDPRRAQQWRDLRGRRVGRQHPWWASRAPVTETRRFESLQGRVLRGRRVVLQGTQAAPVVGVTCPRHRTPQSRARVTLQPRTHFTIQSRARVTVQSRASITKQSRHDTVTVQYGTGPRPQTGRKGPKEMLGRGPVSNRGHATVPQRERVLTLCASPLCVDVREKRYGTREATELPFAPRPCVSTCVRKDTEHEKLRNRPLRLALVRRRVHTAQTGLVKAFASPLRSYRIALCASPVDGIILCVDGIISPRRVFAKAFGPRRGPGRKRPPPPSSACVSHSKPAAPLSRFSKRRACAPPARSHTPLEIHPESTRPLRRG